MKKLLTVLVVLVMVASVSFALEVGGSTATAIIGNGDQQRLEVDQEVDIDLGAFHFDVDGGVDYDLPVKEYAANYLVGASYTFSIFKVGGSIEGNRDVKLGAMKVYADIAVENVGADVDFLISADETKDIFQGAEFSAFYNPGPFEFRVGYLWTENGAPDINAPELLTDGGLYVKAKFSY